MTLHAFSVAQEADIHFDNCLKVAGVVTRSDILRLIVDRYLPPNGRNRPLAEVDARLLSGSLIVPIRTHHRDFFLIDETLLS